VAVNARALYSHLQQDLSGPLLGPEFQSVAAKSLLSSLLKKFSDEGSDKADALAISKFVSVNEQCKQYRAGNMHEWERMMIGEVRKYLYHFFHSTSAKGIFDWQRVFRNAKAGPGSSVGARGKDFYTKHFDSTLTYTHQTRFLVPLYQRLVSASPMWRDAEILRQSRHGFTEVAGSLLSTVKKNADISRTTCTEPSLLMFFQLGIGGCIAGGLRDWGLDIDSQATLNRELARVGSLKQSFGTVDLSSASDSMSLTMMRSMLTQDAFVVLNSLRCAQTKLPSGEPLELSMLSTMGNGYTFPLMTALFTCVVLGVYSCLGIRPSKRVDGRGDNWAVFGDDIIVLERAYDSVVRVLELLGFTVNVEKSFNEGPFRESCGADWHLGVDVRGVYCKTLKSVGARFSLINRLIRWSARHGILLRRTVRYLLESVPRYPVPFLEQDDAGVKVPFSYLGIPGQQRDFIAYRKVAIVPFELKYDFEGNITVPRQGNFKRRHANQYAAVVCSLHGSFSGGTVSLRVEPDAQTYRRCRSRASYWDAIVRQVVLDSGPLRLNLLPVISPDEWLSWSRTVEITLRK